MRTLLVDDDRPRTLETRIKPLTGKQRASYALAGRHRGNFWEGAVRSSKTVVSILKWAEFIKNAPPGGLAMIGRTERTLKRNVLDIMVQIYGPGNMKIIQGSGEARFFGRVIHLIGANDETAVAKIQGMTLIGWYGDEMPTWPEAVYNIARTRLSLSGAKWFATGNPASQYHHLKTNLIDKAAYHLQRDGTVIERKGDEAFDAAIFSFTVDDNPFLDAEFRRTLEQEYSGVFRRRFILGEWCMAEGAIYDSWDETQHVVLDDAKWPRIEEWVSIGVDYGTSNPFHALSLGIAKDPVDGKPKLWVPGEYRYDSRKFDGRQKTDKQYADEMLGWKAVNNYDTPYLVVDPSAASFRVELNSRGVASVAASNTVTDGIRTVSSLVAAGLIRVHYSCKGLIREFPGYAWDDKAAKIGEDAPIKVDDHGLDALRYAIKTTQKLWHYSIYGGAS